MKKIAYKATRAVLLCAALAPFVTAQTGFAQQATAGEASTSQGAVKKPDCRRVPFIKNQMALRTPPCEVPAGPKELTKRQARKLAATAKTPADHLKLAAYYNRQADWLDEEGATYEEASAAYQHSPTAKNLMSPTTAGRLGYLATTFRAEAQSDRALAAAQAQIAKNGTVVANR